MAKLILTHIGWDDWDRAVYDCNGVLYVDVDPREGYAPDLFTKQNNEFHGEPCSPIPTMSVGTEIVFVPCRATWNS